MLLNVWPHVANFSILLAYVSIYLTYRTFKNTKNIKIQINKNTNRLLLLKDKEELISSLENYIKLIKEQSNDFQLWKNDIYATLVDIETSHGEILKCANEEYSSYFKKKYIDNQETIRLLTKLKNSIKKECSI
ncbi:hypothetical protein AXE85_05755 [Gemella sp. oral taxon 928]|uniref:hypothetical protein n=1 Tax=Gemella sp. oral taxon 928 TaxID=1785995 RepID=UPI000767DFDF|nr:hypothetical protein [Gemella sp. oral taxon 928]AME09691.1 hypothetical protein AXE85_05755 [Gemella sp. oral taxon 928]